MLRVTAVVAVPAVVALLLLRWWCFIVILVIPAVGALYHYFRALGTGSTVVVIVGMIFVN